MFIFCFTSYCIGSFCSPCVIFKESYDKERKIILLLLKAKYEEYRNNLEVRQAQGLKFAIDNLEIALLEKAINTFKFRHKI